VGVAGERMLNVEIEKSGSGQQINEAVRFPRLNLICQIPGPDEPKANFKGVQTEHTYWQNNDYGARSEITTNQIL
jgi:hypothetical protein